MALGSTQPLTKVSARNISRWSMHRADNLTTFMCQMSGKLEPSRPFQACTGIALPLLYIIL